MVKYGGMNIHKRLVRWAKDAWALPLVYRVPAIVFLGLGLLYIIIFVPSKQVALSYAAKDTCVSHFTLLPGVLQQSGLTEVFTTFVAARVLIF